MNTALVIGLLVVTVVGFFAYQWWAASGRRRRIDAMAGGAKDAPVGISSATIQPAAPAAMPLTTAPPPEEKLPVVAGQTATELLAKEPLQRAEPPVPDVAVTNEGHGPAQFHSNLRHPEQSFHQPAGPAASAMLAAEVDSGRAGVVSTPLGGHQQALSPEMAQNGGAMIGEHVFAFDGMEPTDFAAF